MTPGIGTGSGDNNYHKRQRFGNIILSYVPLFLMSVKHTETFGKKKMERLAKDEGISVNHVLQLADWRHKFPFILFQSSTEILTA